MIGPMIGFGGAAGGSRLLPRNIGARGAMVVGREAEGGSCEADLGGREVKVGARGARLRCR